MNQHISVLLQEAIDNLNIKPDGTYVDGTFGRGGHSAEILKKLGPKGKLIVFDKDLDAIKYAKEKFGDDPRVVIVHSSFADMKKPLCRLAATSPLYERGDDPANTSPPFVKGGGATAPGGFSHHQGATAPGGFVDGILLDLGVSSPQLDDLERGFSFKSNAPLDMRMDQTQKETAADLVNDLSAQELTNIIKKYGEERFAWRIAERIVKVRETKKIETSRELADIIAAAYPKIKMDKHPATRTFQALRIKVNNELEDLEKFLENVLDLLKPGARLVTICFHSLEYRIMKYFILENEKDQRYPSHVPVPHHMLQPNLKRIALKIKPTQQEIDNNVRSRSAIMQVVERC